MQNSDKMIPPVIVAIHKSSDFERAIRHIISIGGDSDIIACFKGGIASVYDKQVPVKIMHFAADKLPNEFY